MRTLGLAAILIGCIACGGKLGSSDAIPPFDGGNPIDGSGDAADEPADTDASTISSWCAVNAPYATLCDDFDLSSMPRSEWSATATGLSVVGSTAQSSPHALQAKTATPSYLAFDVSSAPYGAKMEAEVQVIADGASSSGSAPALMAIDAEQGQKVELAIVPGTSTGRCTFAGYTSSAPPLVDFTLSRGATWHFVSLKISFNDDGTINLICIVDGTDHGLYELAGSQNLGKVTHTVGARGTTAGPMEAYFDNVVIDD